MTRDQREPAGRDPAAGTESLSELLTRCRSLHRRVCPRQVLGVRIGLLAGRRLGLEVPRSDKRLFVFMETDGCAADGVLVATGCSVGHRTMRILDFGKVAATFVDTERRSACRVRPHPLSRRRARLRAPNAEDRWHAYLQAYQEMPDDELLVAEPVVLRVDLDAIISRPGARTICDGCGEEVINEREVWRDGRTLCRPCADHACRYI